MQILHKIGLTGLAGLLAIGLAACSDGLGPDQEPGTVQVTMSESSGTASASLAGLQASFSETGMTASNVPMDAVDAVNLTINEVQVLPVEEDGENGNGGSNGENGGWISLDVEGGTTTINLVDLPSNGSGVTIAGGQLDPGTYHNVRLFFESAEIVLNSSVTLGDGEDGDGGTTVEAGTHALFIPSGFETGVKVPTARFEVSDNSSAAIDVLADSEGSIQTINLTGTGLLMTPVLTAEAEENQ